MLQYDVDSEDISLKDGPRLNRLIDDRWHLKYLILDEMYMLRKRALGKLDARCRQRKASNALLVDLSLFSWRIRGIYRQSRMSEHSRGTMCGKQTRRTNSSMYHLPPMPQSGASAVREAYDSFEDIFFLDQIMRITAANFDSLLTRHSASTSITFLWHILDASKACPQHHVPMSCMSTTLN
ncbi:MAG: hypothetical protein SGPRY_002725 [Prymnesium sp.]